MRLKGNIDGIDWIIMDLYIWPYSESASISKKLPKSSSSAIKIIDNQYDDAYRQRYLNCF